MQNARRYLIWGVYMLGLLAPQWWRFADRTTVPLIVSAVVAVLLALAAALLQPKQRMHEGMFSQLTSSMVLTLISAAVLAVGGVMQVMQGGGFSIVLGVLCTVGAVGVAVGAIYRRKGANPPARCYVPIILFYAARLFRDFRQWMVDPAIMDYCFLLFALIGCMLAAYHMGAFSFDRGNSRAYVFFALMGYYFGFASPLQHGPNEQTIVYIGSTLWMFAGIFNQIHPEEQPQTTDAQQAPPEQQ